MYLVILSSAILLDFCLSLCSLGFLCFKICNSNSTNVTHDSIFVYPCVFGRSRNMNPVCSGLQAQILSCYRDNGDQTLRCSDLAKQYMQCINAAKKVSEGISGNIQRVSKTKVPSLIVLTPIYSHIYCNLLLKNNTYVKIILYCTLHEVCYMTTPSEWWLLMFSIDRHSVIFRAALCLM